MIRHPLRSRLLRVLGLSMAPLLALTLSACGSGGDESASADGLTKVRVANVGMLPASVDLAWAIEGGFLKKNGLDVTLNPPQLSASDLASTVMNGDADVALVNGTVVPSARGAGRPLTIVATTQAPFPLQLAFTPETDKRLRDQGLSEASSVADLLAALEGMSLGTNAFGSSITATYRYLLAQYGIDPERDNITLQAMPDVASQVAALSNKRVDGLASSLGGAATGAVAQGSGVLWDLTKMSGSEALQAVPYTNVVTTDAVIEKDPDIIQSFLDAIYEAQQSLLKGEPSQEEVASLKKLVGPTMDEKIYDDTIAGMLRLFPQSFSTSDESWDATCKVAEVNTDVSLDIPAADAVNNSFAEKIM